jgi:hypothetical protein
MKKIILASLFLLVPLVGSLFPAGSFTDNANGTVTDNGTGLIWQKCSAPQTYSSGCTGTVTAYDWDSALAYCEGLTLGGSGNWRLPSMNELVSLMDYSRTPAINSLFTVPSTNSSAYWSSTTYASGPSFTDAWIVFFIKAGSTSTWDKLTAFPYVRCVR